MCWFVPESGIRARPHWYTQAAQGGVYWCVLFISNFAMAEVAYCVKCREKRDMQDPNEVEMKGGRRAMQGVCTVCGTKMFKILGKAKTE